MFSVKSSQNIIQLGNSDSRVEIWPLCGAILNNWTVVHEGKAFEVIDGYESTEDFTQNAESKGFRSCKLSPYVCRMGSQGYQFEGHRYQIGKYKLGENSIHGLLYDVPFEIISQHASPEEAGISLQHRYTGTDGGYPFTYTMVVTYTLRNGNSLNLTTEVTNTSASAMPLSDGWHPYFKLGTGVDDLHFEMQAASMVEFDENLLPTGKLLSYGQFSNAQPLTNIFLDNCFLLKNPLEGPACVLANRNANIALSIYPDQHYPYLQIYTPPHRQSIAIENLSSAPDAFNNKMTLLVLEPGETAKFSTTYKIGKVNQASQSIMDAPI